MVGIQKLDLWRDFLFRGAGIEFVFVDADPKSLNFLCPPLPVTHHMFQLHFHCIVFTFINEIWAFACHRSALSDSLDIYTLSHLQQQFFLRRRRASTQAYS
jgi:hypothetical protein